MDWFMDSGIRVVVIIGIAIILFFICRLAIASIMKKTISHRMAGEAETEIQKRTGTLSSILIKIAGILIAIIALITILPEFGVNIATLIAGIGIGGLAIAFAAQSLVRDFISGFFIFLEDQYRIGDVISTAGVAGAVEEISLRRTVLREVCEELGVAAKDIEILGELDDFVTISNYIVTPLVGVIPYPYNFKLSSFEVEKLIEVPVKALLEEHSSNEGKIDFNGELVDSYIYEYDGNTIWGATAKIVHHFLDLIFGKV